MRATQLTILLTFFFGATFATADSVELRGGGHVAGAVKRVPQERTPYVVVDVDEKVRVAIPESQIARVVESADLNEYRQRAAAVKDDADAHYELARWCKSVTLLAQYRHHLQRVISLDVEHAKARAALGYVSDGVGGKWIRHAELQKKRGMVLVASEWRLPEEVAIREVQEEANVDSKRWKKEIDRLVKLVLRGGEKGNAAFAELAAINEFNASYAMAEELANSSKQPQNLRLFWIDKLAAFGNRPALQALVNLGISESDFVVREKALETLQKLSPSTAIANYVPMLRSNDNSLVNRAANALSYFPEPEIALQLVDALVTDHKYETAASQATNVGFGAGGGGLSTGGKATVTIDKIQNPPVLAVLRAIEPDADFGYDQVQWRRYYAKRLSSYSGNMRRDP